ncbi:hypothetical protein GpartN1_g7620.t1 [Galdieria partita]|uniref:Uncharacterized protein n=1 Tax=Galdieria partita TaxID=83374 RepID=A0A9C7Q564_9RHOD|nr:hypothetical protein GpartN1_g7620.t1 [Galdieria partita]
MWEEDSSFVCENMDVFDENRTQGNIWRVNCECLEDLEYENPLNICENPWQVESTETTPNVTSEKEFSVVREEYDFSRQAFCDSSQQSDASVFTFVPLVEQDVVDTLKESSKIRVSEYCSRSEKDPPSFEDLNSLSLPNQHSNWSDLRVGCDSLSSPNREVERSINLGEDSKSFGLLHKRIRVLEEENLQLNLQVSKYKEENSYLREALDRFHSCRSFFGTETVASVHYPESEEDSSANVQDKLKRRRISDSCKYSDRQKCRSRVSEDVERDEPKKNSDNFDGGYFQQKFDSLHLKPEYPTSSTANPVEFVSLVRDLTEPLMKTDPARAATLTMFIFALALGLFSFQCKSTMNTTTESETLEKLLWNNLQDCVTSGDHKGTFFSDMKKGYIRGSLDASSLQDAEYIMRNYLDASVGHILEETSPVITDQLPYPRDDNKLEELKDVTRAYVSTWEQVVELDKFEREEFSGI